MNKFYKILIDSENYDEQPTYENFHTACQEYKKMYDIIKTSHEYVQILLVRVEWIESEGFTIPKLYILKKDKIIGEIL